jgi:hypothetical protein
MTCQRDFPGKTILPLLWYQNYGDYEAICNEHPGCLNSPTFVWTHELLNRMFVPGSLWRKMLELVRSDTTVENYTDPTKPNHKTAISTIATWGEGGYIPFVDAPWWNETINFFKEHNMPIPPAIQAALDALVAASSSRDTTVTTAAAAVSDANKIVAEKKTALLAAVETQWPG